MKNKIYYIAITFVLILCFWGRVPVIGQNTSLPVGAIEGNIDISATGAATYTIPIEVTPGIQGLQPNLSVSYHSQSSMGILGMKWHLNGLSAITRVPQTLYHDNTITAVNLNAEDRFALDGNRLMVTTGTYGDNGTKYVTEMETFSEITSYETAGNGPKYFKVITEEGNIIEYGNTNDSRQMLGSTALSWMISKITDPDGNYMTFQYGQSNGEIWLTSISYVVLQPVLTIPYAKVLFEYQAGRHYHSDFIAGYEIKQTRLLKTITMQYGNGKIMTSLWKYMFDYTGDFPPRLTTVTKTGEDGSQLNATTVSWTEPTQGYYTKQNYSNTPFTVMTPGTTRGGHITGDFNGDGLCDIVEHLAGTTWTLYLQNENGQFEYACRGALPGGICEFAVIDENGDGRDELTYTVRSQSVIQTYLVRFDYVAYPVVEYFYIEIVNPTPAVRDGDALLGVRSGNFSGRDGSEILVWHRTPPDYGFGVYTSRLTLKGKYCATNRVIKEGPITLMDFNGNGKTDICVHNRDSFYIYEYDNITGKIELIKTLSAAGLSPTPHVGDFNGDGISDLLWQVNGNTTKIALGTGDGFSPVETIYLHHALSASPSLIICDINGDGKDDFIGFSNSDRLFMHYYLSQGYFDGKMNFIPYPANDPYNPLYSRNLLEESEAQNGYTFNLGDFNSDRKNDFIVCTNFPLKKHSILRFTGGDIIPLVKEITNGMGYTAKLSYIPFYAFSFDYATFRRRPVFCYLPSVLELSNGIGASLNRYTYLYSNPYFSYPRRSLQGFQHFYMTEETANKKVVSDFILETSKEILKPISEYFYWGSELKEKIIYDSKIQNLNSNRNFIQYNQTVTAFDMLINSKKETITGLLDNGRIDNILTTIYQTPTSNIHLNREQKKFTYTSITLPNGAVRPRVTSEVIHYYGYLLTPSYSHTKTYTYTSGRISSITESNADGAITTSFSSYNNFGLPQTKTVSASGCTSRTETMTYDATGRFLTGITNPLNQTTSYSYNAKNGQLLSETDINGLTTGYGYDGFGRLTSTTFPDGRIQTIQYKWNTTSSFENARYYTVTKLPGTADLVVYYDLLNREVYRQSKSYYTQTKYNHLGQLTHVSLPYSSLSNRLWKEIYTYDGHGRVLTETQPYTKLSYQYTLGRTVTTDSLRGISYTRHYDAMGRTVSTADPGGEVNYYYEIIFDNGKARNQTRITHHGSSTTVRNDQWGNRLYLGDPDAGISTFAYNKFNELISETDANNNTITYQYDQLGRVTSKGYTEDGSAKSTTYLYDTYTTANRGKGQLSSIKINNVLSESYTYDALGRLSQESKIIDGQTYTQGYTYNSDGLTDVISYPNNSAVKYAYDANGDLASIKRNDNSSLIYNVSKRNMLGQVTRSYVGNDIATTYTYDNYGSVTWLSTGNKVYIEEPPVIIHTTGNIDINSEELESDSACTEMNMTLASDPVPYERGYVTDNAVQYLGYSYNPQGLMLSRKDLKHSQCEYFTYDNLDRLTSHTLGACSGGYTPQYYSYSSAGNILSSPVLGDYTYGSGNDKPHAVNHIELSQNYADAISASNCCVTYNAFNRPVYIEEGNQRLTLAYDANRQRIKTIQQTGTKVTKTKYFASGFYEKEVSPLSTRHLNYIYAGNKLIAIFAVDNANPAGKMYYIHTDHLGSYDVITTDNKVVTERYHFDPWGNRKNPTNWTATDTRTSFFFDRGFTGHEHLDAFKIINMNARLYDPVISRFFSPDPYVQAPESSQGFNRYSYCANNPLKFVDPSGMVYGDYYTFSGQWLGSDGKNDNKAYTATKKNADGTFSNAKELPIGNTELLDRSTWVHGECGGSNDVITRRTQNAGDASTVSDARVADYYANAINNASKSDGGFYKAVAGRMSKKVNGEIVNTNTGYFNGTGIGGNINSKAFANARNDRKDPMGSLMNLSGAQTSISAVISSVTGKDPTGGARAWLGSGSASNYVDNPGKVYTFPNGNKASFQFSFSSKGGAFNHTFYRR